MPVPRLTANAPGAEIGDALAREGCAIVERLVPVALLDRARAELRPWLDATPAGPDDFAGRRLVPGRHRLEDRREFAEADSDPAEMPAGSVLFYTGALYHGAGANRSDAVRYGLNITYAVSWLRQEENQYLSVPREIARELPEPLLRLMGYARGAYALGYVDDLRDPLEVLHGSGAATSFGDLAAATAKARAPVG